MSDLPPNPSRDSHTLPQTDPALGPGTVAAGDPAATAEAARVTVREAVAVFMDEQSFQAAVDDLAMAGFAPHELSLMAGDESARTRLGRSYDRVEDAKDDPNAPRQAIIAPEEVGSAQGLAIGVPAYVGAIIATGAVVASGGTLLAAALGAAAAGAGGAGIGAVLASWIGGQRESLMQEQLDKGGQLLWVNIANPEREELARTILTRHSAHPVDIHDIPQLGSP